MNTTNNKAAPRNGTASKTPHNESISHLPKNASPAKAPKDAPAASYAAGTQLLEDMLADLKRSGLDAKDAKLMQLTIAPDKQKAQAGYKIPYFDTDGKPTGFYRKRFLYPALSGFDKLAGKKKPQRYSQPPDTMPHIYYPPNVDWKKIIADPSIDIGVTEGEKKAFAACKAGIPTVALGGVDSFRSAKRGIDLLPGFEDLKAHRLIICYDSEAATKPDVMRAEEALASRLRAIGARVFVARIPHVNGKNMGIDDFIVAHGAAKFKAEVLAPATMHRLKLLSGEELCNAPPMKWLVHGVLPKEGLAAMYGPSGAGKGFLAIDLACAVAGGNCDWFGKRITKTPVIYLCLEGAAGLGKRAKAKKHYDKKPLPNALHFIAQPFNLLSDDVEELAEIIIAADASNGMVIIDTLNRAAPGADENASVDMGRIIQAAERLQILVGGLVVLVHHTGKDISKGLRGHSSLRAALDGAIEVVKTVEAGEAVRTWINSKSKDSEDGAKFPFALKIVEVGKDEIGIPETSCVVTSDVSRRQSKPERDAEHVWRLLLAELYEERYHSQNSLQTLCTALGRNETRAAVQWLRNKGMVESRTRPNTTNRGPRKYLHPLETQTGMSKALTENQRAGGAANLKMGKNHERF